MGRQLVANGTSATDLYTLNQYDAGFQEGDIQELRLDFGNVPIVSGALANLVSQASNQLYGAANANFINSNIEGNVVMLRFQVAAWPLWAVIAAVLGGIGLLVFVAWELWRVFRDVPTGMTTVTILALAALGIAAYTLIATDSG